MPDDIQQAKLLLARTRRTALEVAGTRKQAEQEISGRLQSEATLTSRAQTALAAGREDLTREALTQRAIIRRRRAALESSCKSMLKEQEWLMERVEQLEAKASGDPSWERTLAERKARERRKAENELAAMKAELNQGKATTATTPPRIHQAAARTARRRDAPVAVPRQNTALQLSSPARRA